jgi:hypothetical protein
MGGHNGNAYQIFKVWPLGAGARAYAISLQILQFFKEGWKTSFGIFWSSAFAFDFM